MSLLCSNTLQCLFNDVLAIADYTITIEGKAWCVLQCQNNYSSVHCTMQLFLRVCVCLCVCFRLMLGVRGVYFNSWSYSRKLSCFSISLFPSLFLFSNFPIFYFQLPPSSHRSTSCFSLFLHCRLLGFKQTVFKPQQRATIKYISYVLLKISETRFHYNTRLQVFFSAKNQQMHTEDEFI